MAGVKGRSGGPRKNAGGARPGAGRKPKEREAPTPVEGAADMLDLLQRIALGKIDASTVQVRAAIAAVQYTHAKVGEGGKKDRRRDAAQGVAASGRFRPQGAPTLRAVK